MHDRVASEVEGGAATRLEPGAVLPNFALSTGRTQSATTGCVRACCSLSLTQLPLLDSCSCRCVGRRRDVHASSDGATWHAGRGTRGRRRRVAQPGCTASSGGRHGRMSESETHSNTGQARTERTTSESARATRDQAQPNCAHSVLPSRLMTFLPCVPSQRR